MIHFHFCDNPSFEPPELFIEQISALYRSQRWWSGPDNSDLVLRIIKGSHCFLIAIQDFKTIIGMGRAISDRISDSYIQDVTVQENFRGQGVGTRIVQMIIERLHEDGIYWIGLIAEKDSHGFYEPMGFKKMPDSIPMILSEP